VTVVSNGMLMDKDGKSLTSLTSLTGMMGLSMLVVQRRQHGVHRPASAAATKG